VNVFSLTVDDVYFASVPHSALVPPAVVPTLVFHFEASLLGRDGMFQKASPNVLLQGAKALQLGHDVGALIPHVPIPPVPHLLLSGHWTFSSCKAMFGKSRVLLNGTPAAWFLPIAAMLHVCADPLPLPVGFSPTALFTTVKYGFSWSDLLLGYADITIDQAISHGLREGRGIGAKTWDKDVLLKPVQSRYDDFIDTLAKRIGARWARTVGRRIGVPSPALETIKHLLDKGGRSWLKKGIGKKVPTKSRDLGEVVEGAIDPPPPELHDPGAVLDEGMLDEIPLLEGES